MEKQISIIIPTYNMEAYIGKCLDSLLIPEFDAVEVLVVNDGSKDRSSEIAHSYADRYPGSIRVIDKPNGNYGSCINAALPLATGRYVKVLDADDTFDTQAFSRFVRLLPTLDDDAIITSYCTVDASDNNLEILDLNEWNIVFNETIHRSMAYSIIEKHFIQMHMIAYNRRVFFRFNYHQTEGISYTDTEWAIVPMAYCETFSFVDLLLYRYLTGRTGQTMSSEQLAKQFNHLLYVIESLNNYYINCSESVISEHLFKKAVGHHLYVYGKALSLNSSDIMTAIKEYDERLQNKYPSVFQAIDNHTDSGLSYRYFHEMRKKGYPATLSIPVYWRVIYKLKKFINRK